MSTTTRTAVVTGASSGIGWSLACALARQGVRVGAIARRAERLDALAAEIRAQGGTVVTAPADVGEFAQIHTACHTLQDALGPIDLCIANAGIAQPRSDRIVDHAAIAETFRVNFQGVVNCFDAVLDGMLDRGQGHLVAISSLAAYKGLPRSSAYSASKAALNTYMEGLRIELCTRGIAVTTVCPGFITTPMTAANRFRMPFVMTADRAAERILKALERKPGVYDFPWRMTCVMRLSRWAPDWLIARQVARSEATTLE